MNYIAGHNILKSVNDYRGLEQVLLNEKGSHLPQAYEQFAPSLDAYWHPSLYSEDKSAMHALKLWERAEPQSGGPQALLHDDLLPSL